MDLLTIQHQDFTMYVECTKFDGIWNKAKQNGTIIKDETNRGRCSDNSRQLYLAVRRKADNLNKRTKFYN